MHRAARGITRRALRVLSNGDHSDYIQGYPENAPYQNTTVRNASFLLLLVVLIGCARNKQSPKADENTTAGAAESTEIPTRCGWFVNPSPANAWLYHKDGEWTIAMQGGHQAEGDWPEFGEDEWVATNASYGYGCACMDVTVDSETRQVVAIESAEARPLSSCRSDAAIADWESQQ